MRCFSVICLPLTLLFASVATAQDNLVEIGSGVVTEPVVEYYAPPASEETVTLAPVAAGNYASTAPSLVQPSSCGSPAACCGTTTTYYGCGCSPCSAYSPCTACGTQTTYQPVVTFRPVVATPVATPYRIGHGILGQPKLYVQGQPLRNTLRYLTP